MSEGGAESKTAVPLALTPPPAPQVVPPSPPGGRGTLIAGSAGDELIHHADPAARRKLLLVAPAGIAALLALGWWFHGYLDTLPTDTSQQMIASTHDVIAQLVRVSYCGTMLFALLAAYWFRVARAVDAVPQYPPPQMKLFHDMHILRGEAKRAYARRNRSGAVLALVLSLLSLAAALLLPHRAASDHPLLYQQTPPAIKLNISPSRSPSPQVPKAPNS